MATPTNLGSRRNTAQLHALAGVQREVRASDSSRRRKYLRDFNNAFRVYESVIDAQQLTTMVRAADVILIGDYHALPSAQRFAATLLEQRAQPGDRPVVLGVETIFSRHQQILEEWWRREIDEEELRQRIRFDLDWNYDWPPFYELLVTAREHAEAIYGLDCMPRGDLRRAPIRDRHAADKITEISNRHANAVIMVLFGESHMAPQHLPSLLQKNMSQKRLLTVLQNIDALYWCAAAEARDSVEAVRVDDGVVCVFNSTPLEKYENYRLCLDRWSQTAPDSLDLSPTIYNLLNGLLRSLGINQYSARNGTQPKFLVDLLPEVHCNPSEEFLDRVLSQLGEEKNALLRRLAEGGSVYLPVCNTICIREFRMTYAAEEATRFLYHACRRLPFRGKGRDRGAREPEDVFYQLVLEHCLARFGSRLLCPSPRAIPDDDFGREVVTKAPEDLVEQAELTKISAASEATAQQLGYRLGADLYDAYVDGRATRAFLRALFMKRFEEPGSAREAYVSTVRRVRHRRTRQRNR